LKRRNRARKSNSTHDGNFGPDSDSKITKGSGYNSLSNSESNSKSDANTEPMDVERMMREFEEKGVTLSNLCDEIKANMEVELEKWEE
jgi:flagellar basal body rod protein FlgG